MLLLVLRSRELCALAQRAAREVGLVAACPVLSELASRAAGRPEEAADLVVHDFAPDPEASVASLGAALAGGASFSVFALLPVPATPCLDGLCRLPRAFELAGTAVAGEEGAGRLGGRFRAALEWGGRRVLLRIVIAAWRLDPLLARVAERELTASRPYATLARLLREAGVSRKCFVRRARCQGITPPLRFLQGLRMLEAADLLRQGCTASRAAERLGYGSPDTLRRHFRSLVGIPPAETRSHALSELAATVFWHGGQDGTVPQDGVTAGCERPE